MDEQIKRLSKARQKKGWLKKEVEGFARRRSRELNNISENVDEPDELASGTNKTIEEICRDNEEDE
jgi:hypothetical protein